MSAVNEQLVQQSDETYSKHAANIALNREHSQQWGMGERVFHNSNITGTFVGSQAVVFEPKLLTYHVSVMGLHKPGSLNHSLI